MKENLTSESLWNSLRINCGFRYLFRHFLHYSQVFLNSSMVSKTTGVTLLKPVETADEYEELFKEEIRKYKAQNPKFKKLIVIVDDLDRLSRKKVVDALDAIKAFVDVDECIFIVTCDENILVNALEKEKLSKTADYIDGEIFLDKLFQFRLPLPPIIDSDMKQYAMDLASQEAPKLVANCNGIFEDIINILIHADITTPRQVKKVLNTFANSLLIAKRRENENRKIEKKLLTGEEGLKFLAKISVLQSDYNSVYTQFIQDFQILNNIIQVYYGDEEIISSNPYLMGMFIKKGEEVILKK